MSNLSNRKEQRNADIVQSYKDGSSICVLAKLYNLSSQRIQQIIDRCRKETGAELPRHYRHYEIKTVPWTCPKCGAERHVRRYRTDKLPKHSCKNCLNSRNDERVEIWIKGLRDGLSLREVGDATNLPGNQHQTIGLGIYRYLKRKNRLDEFDDIWHYSTNWLLRQLERKGMIL